MRLLGIANKFCVTGTYKYMPYFQSTNIAKISLYVLFSVSIVYIIDKLRGGQKYRFISSVGRFGLLRVIIYVSFFVWRMRRRGEGVTISPQTENQFVIV